MMSNKPLALALFFVTTLLGCDSSGDSAQNVPEDVKAHDAPEDGIQALPDAVPTEESDVVTPKPDILFVSPDTEIPEFVEEEVDLPADPMVCSGEVEGPLQYIGGACCYTAAWNPGNPNCVWNQDGFGDGECLDQQCESNDCDSARYCTRRCNNFLDVVNNATGESGPDGVNDPGATNECMGAVDGPFGLDYQCVNLRNIVETSSKGPFAKCRPGTDFQACTSNKDCPENEICDLVYIQGDYQSRCAAVDKQGVGVSEYCNDDPNVGGIVRCAGPLCRSNSCVDFCADNGDCATDSCEEGACSKSGKACTSHDDCSAWECQEYKPYSNDEYSSDFCREKSCLVAGDCKDPDWFCRPYWNSAETVEEVEFVPSCRRLPEDTAAYGEPCGIPGDGTGLPACAYGTACIDNYCGGPCRSDSDCKAGAECLRGTEWDIDVNGDGSDDTWINVDLCQKWPHEGELVDCSNDGVCPEGHHCRYRVKGEGQGDDRAWSVEYKCRKDQEDQSAFGGKCGSSGGGECPSNLCLVGGNIEDAMCTQSCSSAQDCPELVQFDGYTWKTICLSLNVSHENTVDPNDDLYAPYCWRVSSIGSLAACDEQKNCAAAKEYCRALAIAGNPDEPVVVEHLCADVGEGLSEYPTKAAGEPCSSWKECMGRSCLPGSSGNGYCSELCTSDSDCTLTNESLRCTEQVLVPRADKSLAGITQRCVLQETCLTCQKDEDCGGDYRCVNIGGLDELADYRCGKPCTAAEDCGETEGAICHLDIDSKGAPTGKKACLPETCPSN